MSATETLRSAAGLMRKDAQAMMPGSPWEDRKGSVWRGRHCSPNRHPMAHGMGMLMSRHVATFGDPAVALAVADLLDATADDLAEALDALAFLGEPGPPKAGSTYAIAIAVATAYLGRDPT